MGKCSVSPTILLCSSCVSPTILSIVGETQEEHKSIVG
jgi:hypothetical protein